MRKGTVLYVGGFILPDKNAAAQRVVTIAKILRDIGYQVVFLNRSPYADNPEWRETSYFGFRCFEQKRTGKKELIKRLVDIEYIKGYAEKFSDLAAIIAYNFPAVALKKLNSYCRSNNIKCIGDVTEWYGIKYGSIAYRIAKGVDSFYRMRIQHKRLSGNIVISDFLEEYYSRSTKVVNLPPLVDKKDQKWMCSMEGHEGIQFIYAGSPGREKERLDLIVGAILELREKYDVKLMIIGVTQEQFMEMYSWNNREIDTRCICFLGKIPHKQVIKYVSEADYSILIRDRNRVTTAGFPTKFAESISCGTPVLANNNSCIFKYFKNGKNGIPISESRLRADLEDVLNRSQKPEVQKDIFDYRNYIEPLRKFMEDCNA